MPLQSYIGAFQCIPTTKCSFVRCTWKSANTNIHSLPLRYALRCCKEAPLPIPLPFNYHVRSSEFTLQSLKSNCTRLESCVFCGHILCFLFMGIISRFKAQRRTEALAFLCRGEGEVRGEDFVFLVDFSLYFYFRGSFRVLRRNANQKPSRFFRLLFLFFGGHFAF